MNETHPEVRAASDGPQTIQWLAVLGFGLLGLLWPLIRVVGGDAVGGAITVGIVFGVTSLVFILGAAFGNVRRPVLTLALAGAFAGTLLFIASLLTGELPTNLGNVLAAAVIEIGRASVLGLLCGLAASAIQKGMKR